MKILDKYIAKLILKSIFSVLGVLALMVGLLDLVDEIKKVNIDYSISFAFIYVFLNIPKNIYELLPIATLMGSLIGLSKLSSTSELNAAKSLGLSFSSIILTTLKTGLLIVLLTFFIGEFLAPKSLQFANSIKNFSQSERLSMKNNEGVWIKKNNNFIHITNVYPNRKLRNVSLYRFNEKQQLLESIFIKEGIYVNNKWIMKNITSTNFENIDIAIKNEEILIYKEFIDIDLLDILVNKPEQMTLIQLIKYIKHLKINSLDSQSYELAFWSKFSIPLSCLVMFLITTPFVHSSIRSASYRQRIFIGILIGIILFLVNQTINKLSLVVDIHPIIGSFMPIFILFVISLFIIFRFYGLKTLLKLFLR